MLMCVALRYKLFFLLFIHIVIYPLFITKTIKSHRFIRCALNVFALDHSELNNVKAT